VALTRLQQAGRDDSTGRRLGAFVILLTDGANNRGALNPLQAADIATSRRIPVYTVGAGKEGWVPVPVGRRSDGSVAYQAQFSQLDEGLLKTIATQTGGAFFRADDLGTIEEAFRSIDRAQKIDYEAKSRLLTTELFPLAALPGLLCLLVAALPLAHGTRGRREPGPAAQRINLPDTHA
jgi:Ca-activated chloride channel family protein